MSIISAVKITAAAIVSLPLGLVIAFGLIILWEAAFGPCPGLHHALRFDSTGCP